YADFALFWMLCHQSRVENEKPEHFWLERWSREAQGLGARALDQLQQKVKHAIVALGQGFLEYRGNQELHAQLRSGALTDLEFYRQLLRIVYRLLFLFVAEDRTGADNRPLLLDPDADVAAQNRYREFYATTHLRRKAREIRGTGHPDLF